MKTFLTKVLYVVKHEGISSVAKRPYKKVIRITNRALINLFRVFPVDKRKVLLESQEDYSDNVRAFYEYVLKQDNSFFDFIWLVQKPSFFKKKHEGRFISRNEYCINLLANYHIATAKYFIFSHPYWLDKWREEQRVIYTTHSVAQLKASPKPKGNRLYDYVLTCSDYCTEIRKKAFYDTCDDHFLSIGQPRIDLMFDHLNCIKRILPGSEDKGLILCMETFKQTTTWDDGGKDDRFSINIINTAEDLMIIDKYLEKRDFIMMVKIHHLQDISMIEDLHLKNIIYLYDSDLQEADIQINQLLENADILLTDYSSVFYDYLFTDKPIGFIVGDMKDYKRGFIMENPLDEMPGEKIHNIDELMQFLDNCIDGIDHYKAERNRIKKKAFKYLDNNNSKRLLDWLKDDYLAGESS